MWKRRNRQLGAFAALAAPAGVSLFHTRPHGVLTPQLFGWLHARDRAPLEGYFRQEWRVEDDFQIALLDTLYAVTAQDFEAIHYPASGMRSKATGGRLKRLGARAGVADLWCGWKGGDGWLELKSASGIVQFGQKQFGEWLKLTDKRGAVIRSISEGLAHLYDWGAPIKAEFWGLCAPPV